MSVPNIPPPPPREQKKRKRTTQKADKNNNALAWLVSLGVGIAAGALSYEWLTPVSNVFNDLVASLF